MAVLVAFLLIAATAAQAAPRHLLVLQSYHQGNRWTDHIAEGIQRVLARYEGELEVSYEFMDTKRYDAGVIFDTLVPLYARKYGNSRPDVIISADDNAMSFLQMHRERLFPGVPIVFCGLNNLERYDMTRLEGVTGVVEDFNLRATLDVALALHPGAKHVASISDDTISSSDNIERLRQLAPAYREKVDFIELDRLSTAELLEALKILPKDTILLHLNFFRDRLGKTYSFKESIRLVVENTPLPMYVCWDWYLGYGAVGGMITSGHLQGETAAHMALDILTGKDVGDIPILMESPNQYMFDYRELVRHKISLDALPPGSVVLHKPESFYFRYKRYIWATTGAFVLLSLLTLALLANILHRRRVEKELTAIFENSLVGIIYLKQGRIIAKVNRRITDIFGYKPSELIGQEASMIHINHQTYKEFGEKYFSKLSDSEILHIEHPFRCKDGREIWCQLSGKALYPQDLDRGVIWVLEDITRRRRIEKALERARRELTQRVEERTRELRLANADLEARISERDRAQRLLDETEQKYHRNLEAIFGSLPESIVTVDDGLHVIEANRSFSELVGRDLGELRGMRLREAVGQSMHSCAEVLAHTLNTQEAIREQRVQCLEGDRPSQTMVLSSAPYYDHTGQFAGAVLVIRDISRLVELEQRLQGAHRFRNIIGQSEKMREVFALLDNLADYDTTVLIQGESGTGKELVAEALHRGGPASSRPFIKVNCSALSESLLESELFGHVKGAFTGAIKDKVGRFEAAEGGTVFLDEIGDISPKIQLKLLRFLESKEFERVGESRTIKANVRILAATHIDLGEKVRRGEFREDLYYRLKVMIIEVPPLRERRSDIKPLVEHFVGYYCEHLGKDISAMDDNALALFMTHTWPGNVRELKHAVEHACIVCDGDTVRITHLPADMRVAANLKAGILVDSATGQAISRPNLDRESIKQTLEQAQWNKTRAARLLGISRRHLYRKIDQFGLMR